VVSQPGSTVRFNRATFRWRGGQRGIDRPVGRAFVSIERRSGRRWVPVTNDLGLRIIAEGVEDAQTLDRLALLGCDLAQGFHVSRPMAADAFTDWLKESEPDLSSWARTGAVLLDPPAAGAANGDGASKDEAPEKRSRTASIGAR